MTHKTKYQSKNATNPSPVSPNMEEKINKDNLCFHILGIWELQSYLFMQMTKYFPSFFKYPWTQVFVQEHKGQKINGCIALVTAMQNIYDQFLKTAESQNVTLFLNQYLVQISAWSLGI